MKTSPQRQSPPSNFRSSCGGLLGEKKSVTISYNLSVLCSPRLQTVKTIDTNDVDWVFRDEDDDMDDENIRIKEIATTSNKTSLRGAKPNQMEWDVMQVSLL